MQMEWRPFTYIKVKVYMRVPRRKCFDLKQFFSSDKESRYTLILVLLLSSQIEYALYKSPLSQRRYQRICEHSFIL